MNINLAISIPFKDPTKKPLKASYNTLLEPFYITERELLNIFLKDYSDRFIEDAREMIFYASLKTDDLIDIKLKAIPEDELVSLKRQLTLCLATLSFGSKHNSDFIKSMSRSKTLADFTVSTTVSNDSGFLNSILKDAQMCVDDLLSILDELNSGDSLARIFVKGFNSYNGYDSNRLWHHRNLPTLLSDETHASKKTVFKGRLYKNGGQYVPKS